MTEIEQQAIDSSNAGFTHMQAGRAAIRYAGDPARLSTDLYA